MHNTSSSGKISLDIITLGLYGLWLHGIAGRLTLNFSFVLSNKMLPTMLVDICLLPVYEPGKRTPDVLYTRQAIT